MRFLVLASAFCLLTVPVQADPLWVRTYNGPDSTYDEVHAIGVDDSGCVIVSGNSAVTGDDAEFVTIKYRPDGDTAWLRHFNPGFGLDGATALAVDRLGNVAVTGYLGGRTSQYGDWATIKYSAAGESLWAAVYDHGDEDRPSCVVVDSAGNSYVTGRVGWLNDLDCVVMKYDPAGNEAWIFDYDGGYDDAAQAVFVDRQGYTHVTGWTEFGGGDHDLMTWKLGLSGESLWASVYDGPAGMHDAGTNIVVDGSGNVVVAGSSNDPDNREDYITIKYGPTGDTLWTRRYNGPGNRSDYVRGLALDGAGSVYVTGTTYLDASHYNYATVKYSPSGVQRWVAYYGGPRDFDRACGLALDADAHVYVAGSSVNSGGQWDVVTIKYDSAGNQQWLERFNMPSTYDEAYVMTLSRQGTVYVAGRTDNDTTGIDYLTLAYGTAGAVEETMNDERGTMNVGPTIVRGVLFAPASGVTRQASNVLLDISGRAVIGLKPGPNDIAGLAPGIYFIRGQMPESFRKLIIQQ